MMPQAETTNPFLRIVDVLDPEEQRRIIAEVEEDQDVSNAATRILDELEVIRREQTALMVSVAELRSQSPATRIEDHELRIRTIEEYVARKRDAAETAETSARRNSEALATWKGKAIGFGGAATIGAATLGLILKLLGALS